MLLLAIPIGLLLARFTKDELTQVRPYLQTLIIATILSAIWFYLTKRTDIVLTSIFIFIVTIISLIKGKE